MNRQGECDETWSELFLDDKPEKDEDSYMSLDDILDAMDGEKKPTRVEGVEAFYGKTF